MKFEISDTFTVPPSELCKLLLSEELLIARLNAINTKTDNQNSSSLSENLSTKSTQKSFRDYSFHQEKNENLKTLKSYISLLVKSTDFPAQLQPFIPQSTEIHISMELAPLSKNLTLKNSKPETVNLHKNQDYDNYDQNLVNKIQAHYDNEHLKISFQLDCTKIPATFTGYALATPIFSADSENNSFKKIAKTKLTYNGEIKIDIPFLGKIAETKIGEKMPYLFQKDCQLIKKNFTDK